MAELCTKTYSEQLREIAELYRSSQQSWPATARQIAVWAINNGHYKAHHAKAIAKAAEGIRVSHARKLLYRSAGTTSTGIARGAGCITFVRRGTRAKDALG